MTAVCATATPVDLLAPPDHWDVPPASEISLVGSDVSSEGTPTTCPPRSEISSQGSDEELVAEECKYQTPCKRNVQYRLDEFASQCFDPTFDLRLTTRLIELMGVRVSFSLTQALGERFAAKPREVDRSLRLILRCLRLLHLCRFPHEDIEVVVAHASAYMRDIVSGMEKEGQPAMSLMETVHIMCVLVYVAHAHCEDQTCPLHVWHKHLFQRYCTLRTVNAAIVGLLERLHFRLRVDDGDLRARLAFLRRGGETQTDCS